MKHKILAYSIAIIHLAILVLVVYTMILCIIYQVWYVSFLAIMACFRFLLTHESCPITRWEDNMREKAFLPSTRGKFIKYYYKLAKRKILYQ